MGNRRNGRGPALPGGGVDPLFSVVFVGTAIVNLLSALSPPPIGRNGSCWAPVTGPSGSESFGPERRRRNSERSSWKASGRCYCVSATAIKRARCVPRHDSVVSKVSSSVCDPVPLPPASIVMAGMSRLIARFESVDPSVSSVVRPNARVTEIAAARLARRPACVRRAGCPRESSWPISSLLFPPCVLCVNCLVDGLVKTAVERTQGVLAADRMSTSIQASDAMALTDVPPPTRPTLKVVLGSAGGRISGSARNRAAQGMRGIGDTEGAVAVAAGARKGDAVPKAANGHMRDAEAHAVNRHEAVDLPLQRVGEQRLDAAQVPSPSSPTVPTNVIVPVVSNIAAIQCARDREEDGEAAAVVADARSAERSFPVA